MVWCFYAAFNSRIKAHGVTYAIYQYYGYFFYPDTDTLVKMLSPHPWVPEREQLLPLLDSLEWLGQGSSAQNGDVLATVIMLQV